MEIAYPTYVQVPASQFDAPLPARVEAAAADAFYEQWTRSLTRFRAMSAGRVQGVVKRTASEADVLGSVSGEIRSAVLLKHQVTGNDRAALAEADKAAKKTLGKAYTRALNLPLERTYATDIVATQLFYLRQLFAQVYVAPIYVPTTNRRTSQGTNPT